MIRPELRKILNIIADQSKNDVNKAVYDFKVIQESGLPASEAYNHIRELASLELITIGIKVSGADFRMLNITKKGKGVKKSERMVCLMIITK
jgi:hypothetical protein